MDLDKILSDIDDADIVHESEEKTEVPQDGVSDDSLELSSSDRELPVENNQDVLQDESREISSDQLPVDEKAAEEEPAAEFTSAEEPSEKAISAEIKTGEEKYRSCPGSKTWNTIPPYILDISQERVSRDINKLKNSYYFTDRELSDSELKEEVKRTLLQFIRKRSGSVLSSYEEFIFKSLIISNRYLGEYFGLKDRDSMLLLYHTGVENIASIFLNSFKKASTGFCFFQDESGNTVRFLPVEYINSRVVKWFSQNIDILSLPFDSVAEFEKIKTVVTRKYLADEKKFKARLQLINSKTAPQKKITSEELLKIKGDDWYGNGVLTVYQRFVGKRVFRA